MCVSFLVRRQLICVKFSRAAPADLKPVLSKTGCQCTLLSLELLMPSPRCRLQRQPERISFTRQYIRSQPLWQPTFTQACSDVARARLIRLNLASDSRTGESLVYTTKTPIGHWPRNYRGFGYILPPESRISQPQHETDKHHSTEYADGGSRAI